MRTILLAMLVLAAPLAAQARDCSHLSDAQIRAAVVRESRQAYYRTGHPCACPDDHMRNGRRCGNVSAYVRPGGASPLCYPRDVSAAAVRTYCAR